MTFTVPGDPFGKQRPRVANGRAYTPSQTKDYETKVAWCFRQGKGKIYDGPVYIAITAYYPIPKRASKAERAEIACGARLPLRKPDADNIAKVILDALNGLAYHDDAQVVGLTVLKRYGEPRVEVNIMGKELS